DRVRIRRIKRFESIRKAVSERIRNVIGGIVRRDNEAVKLRKAVSFRLKEVEDKIARSIVYVRSTERRKALMEIYALAKSVRCELERTETQKEISLLQLGVDFVRGIITKIVNYAKAGFSGIPKTEDSITHELAQRYYTVLNADNHHFTMNAVRLTDLTAKFLEGMNADFFVSYQIDMGKMTSPWTRVANTLLQLAEFLSELMRRKGRRERVRNKSKGHYGTVKYDEPIHTIIDLNRIPVDEQPLNTLLGNSYVFMRDKAISLGRPELANRIISWGIYVIPERKSKLSKREILTKDATLSYEYRFRYPRYY
ncbi:MAG: hypothetical protein DRP74_08830, partial [Candidatus Omnitrophota bacterium]